MTDEAVAALAITRRDTVHAVSKASNVRAGQD